MSVSHHAVVFEGLNRTVIAGDMNRYPLLRNINCWNRVREIRKGRG